jgi:predicted DNA-binding protein (MmcQ/YjbR family)
MKPIGCSKLQGMNLDWLREHCLSYPGATEQLQWGDDLLFKVGGKMFAIAPLEPGPLFLSFKASPETFAELTERPGILPAPYLARAKWVALETRSTVPPDELALLLRASYDLVVARLPKKSQYSLAKAATARTRKNPRVASRSKTSKK